jgi:hypothetical protein
MKAAGEHLILKVPPKRETTDGGIIIKHTDQRRMYGKIRSIGKIAVDFLGLDDADEYALFDPISVTWIEGNAAEPDECVVRADQVLATMTSAEAEEFAQGSIRA